MVLLQVATATYLYGICIPGSFSAMHGYSITITSPFNLVYTYLFKMKKWLKTQFYLGHSFGVKGYAILYISFISYHI